MYEEDFKDEDRNAIVRGLRKAGKTLQAIGDEFHISKERARQLTKGIVPNKVKRVKPIPRTSLTLKERLFSTKVVKVRDCLEWQGSTHNITGYGLISFHNKSFYAHRAIWLCMKGEIPEGMEVMHSCDNPKCVNIKHLSLGTHKQNMEDRDKKGRWHHPGVGKKLSFQKAQEIRNLYNTGKYTMKTLSEMFQVSHNTINSVLKNKLYKQEIIRDFLE